MNTITDIATRPNRLNNGSRYKFLRREWHTLQSPAGNWLRNFSHLVKTDGNNGKNVFEKYLEDPHAGRLRRTHDG